MVRRPLVMDKDVSAARRVSQQPNPLADAGEHWRNAMDVSRVLSEALMDVSKPTVHMSTTIEGRPRCGRKVALNAKFTDDPDAVTCGHCIKWMRDRGWM